MSGYVYLIRVGDLYRIGKTDNLEKKIKKLKPDELLTSIMTKEPETLEARLLRKYKSQRIPETGYLKLSKRQIRIACESQKRINYFEPSIKNWLDSFEKNKEFKTLMYKYELWEPNYRKNYFPFN